MFEVDSMALFLAGLLGGGHCAGMCGGIVAAFSLQLPQKSSWRWHLAFNLGRILGYGLIGVLLAGLAGALARPVLDSIQYGLLLVSRLLLIGMGMQIAGWAGWIRRIEKIGLPVWRKIQPVMTSMLPVRNIRQCLLIGMLWGWLPCGLVYTASLAAMTSADPIKGGSMMLLFGLGTLPNLLLIAAGSEFLRDCLRQIWIRRALGLVLIGVGIYPLLPH